MNDTLANRILDWIQRNPGQRAAQIASGLSEDRKTVSAIIRGALRGSVRQDQNFRWWLAGREPVEPASPPEQVPQTKVGRLARYFMEAVARDVQLEVSVYASSSFNDLDYAELPSLPALADEPIQIREGLSRLVSKAAKSKEQDLFIGYPIFARKLMSKKGNTFWMLEPLLLLPYSPDGTDAPVGRISFNHSLLAHFAPGGPSAAVAEGVEISSALGLRADATELPDLEDVLFRLPNVRPDWPWVERIDPFVLSTGNPLTSPTAEGILNRAAVFLVKQKKFTAGLENELEALGRQRQESLAGTALGGWVDGAHQQRGQTPHGLIEVVSLNAEQRDAVQKGLTEPLTVITGPPGTGKSQVVTSLIANAVWNGQTVLFSSHNNRAVDVVEERVNGLADRPVMVRIANRYEFITKLAEQLGRLLASGTDLLQATQLEVFRKQYAALAVQAEQANKQLDDVVKLRNRIAELEDDIAPLKQALGEARLRRLAVEATMSRDLVEELDKQVRRCDREQHSIFSKLIWPLIRKGRLVAFLEARSSVAQHTIAHGLSLDDEISLAGTLVRLRERVALLPKVAEYVEAAERLKTGTSDADIALILNRVGAQKTDIAGALWRLSLSERAARMAADERKAVSNFASTLKMQLSGGSEQASRKIDWIGMLKSLRSLIPCWAVTALSAKGRIPYEAGVFDLVVIDEASQCDIGSTLPLLYRAKRAVILGDPMQLPHITTLSTAEDQRLLQRFGLAEDSAYWSFTQSSLFNLAATLVGSEHVVVLKDHHRSHADIIDFSNQHFYEGKLRVATRYDRLRVPPRTDKIISWRDVSGPVTRPLNGGALQNETAKATVAALRDLLVDRNYGGTVGVVTPFRAQKRLLQELIETEPEITARAANADLMVDVVHSFQGNERDTMLFSLVCGPGMTEGALAFLRGNGNLFNVAVTRARAALIVVGDKVAASRSGVSYLEAFVRHVDALQQPSMSAVEVTRDFGPNYPSLPRGAKPVSDEERLLYLALYKAGIKPYPQFPVGAYHLDLAIFDGDRKLDIEVDGRLYHWDGERVRHDLIRNQRLIELGWHVRRFWGSQVRDDPDGCVRSVMDWMANTPTGGHVAHPLS